MKMGLRLPFLCFVAACMCAAFARAQQTDSLRFVKPTGMDTTVKRGRIKPLAVEAVPDSSLKADSTGKKRRKTDAQFGRNRWPRPGVALTLGLVLPGAAQAYNKQFWKMPLVWGALFAFGAPVVFYHNEFVRLDDLYKRKFAWTSDSTFRALNPNDPFPGVAANSIQSVRNSVLSVRDNFIFWFSLAYILQAIEGYVAAHLRYFTVSDDLALQISPALQPPPMGGGTWVMGGKLSLHFR
jgi:hypothetical protein